MIISRIYATYGQLLHDNSSRDAIVSAFLEYDPSLTVESILDLLNINSDTIAINTELGSGIPASVYNDFSKSFILLDEKEPYDNGYTYRDVTGSLFFPSRQGKALMQVLYSKQWDGPSTIVEVIAFENNNGSVELVKPWHVGTISLP